MILKSKVSQKMELIQHQNVKENPSCQNHWRLEESEHEIAKPENAKKKFGFLIFFFFSSICDHWSSDTRGEGSRKKLKHQ